MDEKDIEKAKEETRRRLKALEQEEPEDEFDLMTDEELDEYYKKQPSTTKWLEGLAKQAEEKRKRDEQKR